MRAIALIALLLPLTAEAGMLGGGRGLLKSRTSPTAARYEFNVTGGDWAVPANAPPATLDCRGDFRSGACGATTFTPSGSPALASTYWRPGGGATAGSGVAFDGVDDKFAAGANPVSGDFTVCARFSSDTVAVSAGAIVGAHSTADRSWRLYRYGSSVILGVCKDDSACTSSTGGAIGVAESTVACFSYDFVADGSSVLRGHVGGAALAAVTNAVGPLAATEVPLWIGSYDGGNFFGGSISRVTLWSGWAATAADLSRMVRSQYAAQGSLGEPLTVTRASSKACSIGGAWFTVPSGQPCIGDAGLSVEGSRTQYALNNCTTPADQTVTLATGAHTLWLEGTGTVAAAVGTATATGLPCTATAASACSFTVSAGGTVTLDATGTVDRMQVENGAKSSLICATTTPVNRAADVVTAGPGIASGARWCVLWVGALPSWSPSSLSGLWQLGSTTPNLARMFVTTTKAYLLVSDAAGGELTQSWTHGFANGSRHSITACSDSAGAMTISVDGAAVTPTASGAGTGIIGAMPATMLIGSYAATRESNGSTESVTTCNTATPGECL